MKKYWDAHCHLHLMENPTAVFEKARKDGLDGVICNAVKVSDWKSITDLSAFSKDIHGTFGVHPLFISEAPLDFERLLLEQLTIYSDFGVGECGLDYRGDLKAQERLLQIHLEAGYLMKRPVHIHCVHAFDKLLHVFKKRHDRMPPCLIMHSYLGNVQTTAHLLSANPFFSFSMRFFKGGNFSKKEDLLKSVPLDKLLVESDAQDVSTSLLEVKKVAENLAQMMRIDEPDLSQILFQNTERFLSWKKDLHG